MVRSHSKDGDVLEIFLNFVRWYWFAVLPDPLGPSPGPSPLTSQRPQAPCYAVHFRLPATSDFEMQRVPQNLVDCHLKFDVDERADYLIPWIAYVTIPLMAFGVRPRFFFVSHQGTCASYRMTASAQS